MKRRSLNILILEDEQAPAAELIALIAKLRPEASILATIGNVSASKAFLSAHPEVDLIISDVKLEDGVCFDALNGAGDAGIIFTTAYDEYALRAFDYNCADFLLKPVTGESLERAIGRYEERGAAHVSISDIVKDYDSEKPIYRKRLLISHGMDTLVAPVSDICLFLSDQRQTQVLLKDGRHGVCDHSLQDLEECLDPHMFFRANRQSIVCLDQISRISPGEGRDYVIGLKKPYEDTPLALSRERGQQLREILDR